MSEEMDLYFHQVRKRKAEFISPPNVLRSKLGTGGLSEDVLDKAQKVLEESSSNFIPLGQVYLESLMQGIEIAKGLSPSDDIESIISTMLYPAMQLKANGAMFQYTLITQVASSLVNFLEVIDEPNIEVVEIVLAFHTAMKAILHGQIKGDGGAHGADLLAALNNACTRYFSKNAKNLH